jgi:hypothetical protein
MCEWWVPVAIGVACVLIGAAAVRVPGFGLEQGRIILFIAVGVVITGLGIPALASGQEAVESCGLRGLILEVFAVRSVPGFRINRTKANDSFLVPCQFK